MQNTQRSADVNYKIAAIVPLRHTSERVPGKNYRSFAGQPLYHYIIKNLLACPLIATVIVDTDSQIIMEDCQRHFPVVTVRERPEHLRAGTVPMNEVLLNAVTRDEADFYLQTHSTNPLLTTATITKAIETFLSVYPVYDTLFSVTRLQTRLWDQLSRAVNHNPAILLRTQDLPPIYEENSCIYIFNRNTLESRQNRIGVRPFMFEIDKLEASDIDEEIDFVRAEFFYNHREEPRSL
ncbi:MAG: acylneuraminate cytidylyltransferase family protein [Deltaproteobacteria bacterium]|nr:acylneuraminate cytidylyltransferase family protein [Deltaproteobacteria bacterium]TLN04789.1 MAG: acylneuraminate cytidylyltransferase family protein [bacterium]